MAKFENLIKWISRLRLIGGEAMKIVNKEIEIL